MLDYSARHYQAKCAKDREAVEEIYKEVQKASKNAIFRNIGDIFFTARTDTEINGAVECNGGVYSTADFSGSQNIGNLLANGSLPYISLSEYESIVSANGSCRAFAWGGGTEFRVPTLNDVYIQAGKALSAGEFIPESLPNITGYMANWASNINTGDENSALYGTTDTTGKRRDSTSTATGCSGINFDASRSSSTYQEGSKVKPDSIRYRAMVQLANGATDQAVITATSALQQLDNKADKDLSNISEDALAKVTTGYPTSEVTIIEDTTWVATDNGFACATGKSSEADNNLLAVYNTTTLMGNGCGSWIKTNFYVSVPVSKGDVVTFTASRISGLSTFFVKGK